MNWVKVFRALHSPNTPTLRDGAPSDERGNAAVHYAACFAVQAIVLLLCLAWGCGAVADDDPFISTIEKAKRSVAPVACLNATPVGVINITAIDGSAFLIDEHGTFLTAAHVIKDFLPGSQLSANCGAVAIYLPEDRWGTGHIRWFKFPTRRLYI